MLYTIGYHGYTLRSLIAALNEHKIDLLVDVRSVPYSHYDSGFNRENLKRVLGTRYIWKGYCLGGKKGVKQPGYNQCLEWLATQTKTQNVCVMCMESDPATCHRDFWIASDMQRRFKIDVTHLGRKKMGKQQRFP